MTDIPSQISIGAMLAPLVDWLNTNGHSFFAFIGLLVEGALNIIEAGLLSAPEYVVVPIVGGLVFMLLGIRLAVLCIACLAFCSLANLWVSAMQTIALILVSVGVAVLIAFPIGVLASRRKGIERLIRPVLDIMQTVPPWVYLIPAVIFFSLGRVPALMATIIYGIPPMLRLTTLGLRQVPREFIELGQAIGASPMTVLFKIELPAAKPTILLGLNQCILMSLAMVVLAGLVGAGGLGAEVTRGLSRMEMGLGLRAGLAIVAIALMLDRLSRAAFKR